ncbi:septum site-determining protein MinC [Neisseriaceae bacterium B1]
MKPVFDLTSTRLDALSLRFTSNDWRAAAALLNEKAEQYQQFHRLPLILDISALQRSDASSLTAFVAQLLQKGLRPIALHHKSEDWSKEAAALKLLFQQGKPLTQTAARQPQADIDIQDKVITISNIRLPENTQQVAPAEQDLISISETARRTVVVNTPVRTGQQVYAEDADLIVLGMVSEGAEVIADGNIHIYAPMRGRALAGEKGDKTARIFVQSMQAELVSIAGIYRVFEQDLPAHLHKHPVRVELIEDRLSVGAINAQ